MLRADRAKKLGLDEREYNACQAEYDKTPQDGFEAIPPPAIVDEAAVRRALEPHGAVARVAYEAAPDRRWRAKLASHAAAEAAVAALATAEARAAAGLAGVVACFAFHNGRPYAERGWTTLESGVATEAEARCAFYPLLRAALAALPPKVVEIDGSEPVVAREEAAAGEGAGPRIEGMRAALAAATFTGKGDKPVVLGLYNGYVTAIGNAMIDSGERQEHTYEGERNAAGEEEGRGTRQFADGTVYTGEWRAGREEGRGTSRWANGQEYTGEWKAGEKDGRGTLKASGVEYSGEWKAGKLDGRGTRRYASGVEYSGEWKAGKQDGRGTYRDANGNESTGEYKAGKRDGRGTYRWADGRVDVSRWKAGAPIGEGARWSADGQTAVRLLGLSSGKKEAISLEEARAIAARVGEPAPFD